LVIFLIKRWSCSTILFATEPVNTAACDIHLTVGKRW
jgi:hypothetical protein